MTSIPELLQIAQGHLNARRLDETEQTCRQILTLDSRQAETMQVLSISLLFRGQHDEAIQWMRKAILIRPNCHQFYSILGNICASAGQPEDAARYHQRSAELEPLNADYFSNTGLALRTIQDFPAAAEACRRALHLQPNHWVARNNLGLALKGLGDVDGAIAEFQKVVAQKPTRPEIGSNLLMLMLYSPQFSPEQIAETHWQWGQRCCHSLVNTNLAYPNDRSPNRALKVGYVSGDLRQHAVVSFLEPLLAHHNHSQFEIFCYSNGEKEDEVTQRLRGYADNWRAIHTLSDDQFAQCIRRDQIDILVDLSRHTGGNRLLVFARKPAPIQITYLGYPATTGLPTMDYRFTDALCDPPDKTDKYHSEKLLRLPECFLCFQPLMEAPPVNVLPSTIGNPITFGTFNNLLKTTPQVIALWSQILKQIPRSRMLIKASDLKAPTARSQLLKLFAENGVEKERIQLLDYTKSFQDHLALYNQIDIALDTFPYNGTTTTCEAMWMGVPVVTLAGKAHVSRVGLSIMTTTGLPSLIAQTPEDYVVIVKKLAADLQNLALLRASLRQRMRDSALMDAPGLTIKIESAYRSAWIKWCQQSL